MKLISLLTVLVVVLTYVLNDAVLANKLKPGNHQYTSTSTSTSTSPAPSAHTNRHHHHRHHHHHHRHHHHPHHPHTTITTSTTTRLHRPHVTSITTTRATRTSTHPSTRAAGPQGVGDTPISPPDNSDDSDSDGDSDGNSNSDSPTIPTLEPISSTSMGYTNVVDPNGIGSTTGAAPKSAPSQGAEDPNELSTDPVVPNVSNGRFALAVGLSVGGVAAVGLVGYAVHRRRENKSSEENVEGAVNTRWGRRSFLAKVESIVARLPMDGSSSRLSGKSKKSRSSGGSAPSSPGMDVHNLDPHGGGSPSSASVGGNVGYVNPNDAYGFDHMEEVHLR